MTESASARRSRALLLLLGTVAVAAASACSPPALAGQAAASSRDGSVPTIAGVRAFLYRNKTGEWSEDVLAPGYGGSWNTIAGPNAANATLVVVEVSGPPGGTYTGYFGPATKYAVRLVAREGRQKVLLNQSQVIPVLNDQGKVSLPFLLHQGGCAPVRLTLSVVGVHAPPPVYRSLSFACGE
jgi:hypothetical protein